MKFLVRSENSNGKSYGVVHFECEMPHCSLLEALEIVSRDLNFQIDLPIKELLEMGSIYLNNERILVDRALKLSDRARVHTSPRRFVRPENLDKSIVYEDEFLAVINKPGACHVHATVDNTQENLLAWLEDLGAKPLHITHRLDYETSGLLLLAKNKSAQAALNEMFRTKLVHREYWAISHNAVQLGHYTHYMLKSPKAPKTLIDQTELADGESYLRCDMSVLECKQLFNMNLDNAESRPQSLWAHKVQLQTGRPQQIRAQFAHLSAPLVGDTNYQSSFQLFHGQQKHIGLLSSEMKFQLMGKNYEFSIELEEWFDEKYKIIFNGMARP